MKLKHKLISAVLSAVLLAGSVSVPNTPLGVTASAASTKLAAPTGVKATKTSSSVKLSWKAVSGAGGYRVYMYNASTKKYEKYKDVTGTTCTIKGLKASTTYKFKVATLKFSTQSSSKTLSKKTSSSATSVKLTWSAVKGADGYRVYKYNASTKKYVKYKDVLTASCTVTGLKASTTYKFKITPLKFTVQNTTNVISAKTTGKTTKPSIPVTPASDFEYGYTDSGELRITKYKGKETAINFPDKIDGIVVREIGEKLFQYRNDITSIIIPDTVTVIRRSAFRGCSSLTDVTLSANLSVVEEKAFCECFNIKSMSLPSTVTSIGEWAFNCSGFKELTIPDGVTGIPDGAFCGSEIESLTIPESVTWIGQCAFYGCSKIKSLTIPKSVYTIDYAAFCQCSNLKTLTIKGCHTIGTSAFNGCKGIKKLTIPGTVNVIDGNAFSGCTGLTTVTIKEGVTKIGDNAFGGCTALKTVSLPDSITSVGNSVFNDCDAKVTYKGRVYFPSTYEELYRI